MKTTIEISDALLSEAREIAVQERVTLRSLIEQGLRQVIGERRDRPAFKLRRATFKGQGLQADFQRTGWDEIRDATYAGHGA